MQVAPSIPGVLWKKPASACRSSEVQLMSGGSRLVSKPDLLLRLLLLSRLVVLNPLP